MSEGRYYGPVLRYFVGNYDGSYEGYTYVNLNNGVGGEVNISLTWFGDLCYLFGSYQRHIYGKLDDSHCRICKRLNCTWHF